MDGKLTKLASDLARLDFAVPIKTESELNTRRHWRAQHAHRSAQKHVVELSCYKFRSLIAMLKPPYIVKLVRLGKRKLDSDNLQASFKYVRDSIAEALGVDDGDESKVRWEYDQRVDKEYLAHVSIEGKVEAQCPT